MRTATQVLPQERSSNVEPQRRERGDGETSALDGERAWAGGVSQAVRDGGVSERLVERAIGGAQVSSTRAAEGAIGAFVGGFWRTTLRLGSGWSGVVGPSAGWRRKRRRSGGWGGEKGRETARNDRFPGRSGGQSGVEAQKLRFRQGRRLGALSLACAWRSRAPTRQ